MTTRPDPSMWDSIIAAVEQMESGEELAIHEFRNRWQDLAGIERTASGTGGTIAQLSHLAKQGLVILIPGESGGIRRIVKP